MIGVFALVVPVLAAALAVRALPEDDTAVRGWLDEHLAGLVETYRHLHAHPELSLAEHETAAAVATQLRASGYAVTEGVGGTGVVGILANGDGPTVLVRGDMDALPVVEETGLPYASTVRVATPAGGTVGVMHACGHDVHTTVLLGTGAALSALRARWAGTVVLVAQPAEEIGRGALGMIADGLFERFPRPDATLALHVSPELPVGRIGYTSGFHAANVDSVDIIVHGRGGHGARPHQAIDPIVAAAEIVTVLQTLVSRRVSPTDPAVVTVGSFHGGTKHNVIPDTVTMQLTVRSYSDEVRALLLDGIRQIAVDTCRAYRCPVPPTVTVSDEYTPAAYNDPALTASAVSVFSGIFGAEAMVELQPGMTGEDYGRYARVLDVPGFMFRLGSVPRAVYDASRAPDGPPLPSIHSSQFAPDDAGSLRVGVRAMSNLALALLAPPESR